jgi:DNA-binding NtrC family response regulator
MEGPAMAERLLIVDDEPDMLVLLKMILKEKTAYEVVTTPNPVEAEQLFREKPFQLVITDLSMPGMDGFELTGIIKKMDPLVPVIIITAYGSIESAVQSTQKGAFDFITKPFRKDQIIQSIEKALAFRKVQMGKNQIQDSEKPEFRLGSEIFFLPYDQAKEQALRQFHQQYFRRLLERYPGDMAMAAKESGLPEEELKKMLPDQVI